jgi:hypothetical protein
MKITAQFSLWASIVFGLLCLGIALYGFSQLDAMADAAARADARGFAYFWLFMGSVAVACAIASWWILKCESQTPSD